MLDVGWSELVLIGVVALIVVGPKDLPRMFHALGRVTAKARGMAREFQRAMDDAAKASGLDEVKKDLNGLQTGLKAATNPSSLGINALEDAARKFENWDPKTVMRPGAAAAAAAPAAATAAAAPPAAAAAELGPETKALAEKRAADAAASRAKALELQANAAAQTSAGFAAKAKAEAEAAAMKQAEDSAAAPAPKPRAPRAKKVNVAVEAVAEAPARKPPVRRKKSDG